MDRFPRARAWLELLLHTHDTPDRTAAAFALGVLIGFSPLLGLHTILAVLLAFAFRLNRVAVLLGVYANLPWFMVPYYTLATWLGALLLRIDIPPDAFDGVMAALEHRSWREFQVAALGLERFLWPFTLGSTIGAVLLAFSSYRAAFVMISRHRQRMGGPQTPEN